MKSYKVKYSKRAENFIKKNKMVGIRFYKAFSEISEDPFAIKNYDIKCYESKKYNDIFRLRIGNYRAIFRILKNEITILVFNIDHRSNIYKKQL